MSNSIKLYQSNKLTEARYSLSLIEKRCLYLIIREIRKKFIETNEGNRTLFDNMIVLFTTKDLEIIADKKRVNEIYQSLKNLRARHITIDNEDVWINTGFINYSKHKKKSGIIELEVSKEILPYLVNLAQNYTAYSLNVALSLKSEYSQRFYELCSQWKNAGGFKKDLEDLKKIFELEDKYKLYAHFKSRVLEPAKKELKELFKKGECDLYFNYSEIKQGRKITTVSFKIIVGEQRHEDIKEIYYFVAKELYNLFEVIVKPKNKEFIDLCLNKLHLNPEQLNHIKNKLNYCNQMQFPLEVKVPYIRSILNDDIMKDDLQEFNLKKEKEQKEALLKANEKIISIKNKKSNKRGGDDFKTPYSLFDS